MASWGSNSLTDVTGAIGDLGGGIVGGVVGGVGGGLGDAMESRFGGARDFADQEIAGNMNPGALQGQRRRRNMLLANARGAQGRMGASARFSDFRGRQENQLDYLRRQARGEGPSMAQMAAKEQLDRGIAAQHAQAAGARPSNQAMAARMAAQNSSALAGATAGTAAMGRAQELANANQLYAQGIGQARGQDQSRNLANLQAEMQQRGLNDAQQRSMLEMELRNAALAQQGALQQAGLRNQILTAGLDQPTNTEKGMGMIMGAGQALASLKSGGA